MEKSAGEKNLSNERQSSEVKSSEKEQPMELDNSAGNDDKSETPNTGGNTSNTHPSETCKPTDLTSATAAEGKGDSKTESETAEAAPSHVETSGDQARVGDDVGTESDRDQGDGKQAPAQPLPAGVESAEVAPPTDEKKADLPVDMQVDEESQGSSESQDTIPGTTTTCNTGTSSPTCYCGKDRHLGTVELQCGTCLKWYHHECVNCFTGTCIPFMTNYQFCCKRCNLGTVESFFKKTASTGFSQMCLTAMANLAHQHPSSNRFSIEKEIIPYIEKHWENLTTMPRRVKLTWHTTLLKSMIKDSEMFVCKELTNGDHLFGLVKTDLAQISPYCEALKAAAAPSRTTEIKTGPATVDTKRTTKRRFPVDYQQLQGYKTKRSDMGVTTKMAPHGYPLEHPFNKDGYRYILAEPDPHAPNRQAFDESLDWAGKPIPGYLYRTFLSSNLLLALHDRAPQLRILDDRLTVIGEKGYSMVRATHGVGCGRWYYEVIVDDMPLDTAARVGWSQQLGNLQAPCGYDKFSYSWRSKSGTRFHQSRGRHYSDEGYETGDVIGFYIQLPEPCVPGKLLPSTSKDKPLVKFKSNLYYEEKDYVSETEKALKPAAGSKMIMFKNGESVGVAYEDVYEGFYFPCISLYKNATVSVNFGPEFRCPPKNLENFKPMAHVASQAVVEHVLSDIIYHIENEGRLPEF